jgi:hypothetical protein
MSLTQSIIALTLIYQLHKSLGHAESSQPSLVVPWQRIYNSFTVTHANIKLTTEMDRTTTELSIFFHIATDGQSVSKSWCQAPSGAQDHIFITVWQLRSCSCGAPSLTRRRVCLFYVLLALANCHLSWVEFYVTTEGQPDSLSWYKAPIWGLRPDLYYSNDNYGFFSCGAPSLTRGRVWLASAIFLWSESLESRDHILLSHIWNFPFRRLLRLARSRWRYSIPPPHGDSNCQLLLASRYIVSGRTTTQKTHPLPSNVYMRTHTENTSCNTGSFFLGVYCERYLEMVLLYCWLRICYGLVHRVFA